MALRFRKSITLFPGVKINLSRSGPSLSVGIPGFRKTYHVNGRVTTTVGLPGTGVSWTETSRPGQRERNSASDEVPARRVNNNTPDIDIEDIVSTGSPVVTRSAVEPAANTPHVEREHVAPKQNEEQSPSLKKAKNYMTASMIKSIYVESDDDIEWTEIVAGADAEELLMEEDVWEYCSRVASRVVSGDIDAYLEVIEELRPVDDLLYYGCNFEFGTDKSSYIEVEFTSNAEEILKDGLQDSLLEELVCAVAIRVAKDMMAALPISKVVVHAVVEEKNVLSALFEKKNMLGIDYKNSSSKEIVQKFKNSYGISNKVLTDVARIEL